MLKAITFTMATLSCCLCLGLHTSFNSHEVHNESKDISGGGKVSHGDKNEILREYMQFS